MVADPAVSAISIVADDVTLDLNGFTISGPVTCDRAAAKCSHQYGGWGVSRDKKEVNYKPSVVRESSFSGNGMGNWPNAYATSMGNNLCEGAGC